MRIFILTLLLSNFVFSIQFDKNKIDSLLNLIEQNNKGMGSLAISENGIEIYQKSIGYLDFDNKIKSNSTTKFRIGSISKSFTATMIMKLIEEGKLKLDTKLNEFLPEFPKSDLITIEMLLRHRTGIFNFTNDPNYLNWNTESKNYKELLDTIIKSGFDFEPNAKSDYSNSNYIILSLIAEKVEKMKYEEILNKLIIQPLNLENTYYGSKINPLQNEVYSYVYESDWVKYSETDLTIPKGAGAIVSNPTDLNKFYYSLFNGKIVNKQSLEIMKNIVEGYGIGLFDFSFYERVALGHTGGIDAFHSSAAIFPNENIAVAYCSNGEVYPMNDILIGVLSILFNKEYKFPNLEPVKLSTEELEKYLGVYSSSVFPLKITISKNKNILIGQATGQPTFTLDAKGNNKFNFDPAGLELEFKPETNEMILRQGDGEFTFKKD